MAWVRVSDNTPRHPRVVGLSDPAFRLWVEGLCWSSEYLTDGHISPAALTRLARHDHAPELVDAGLWETTDSGGHTIRDYLDYQPSRAKVEADRANDRRRKGSGRNPGGIRAESEKIPDAPSHPIPITKDLSSSNTSSKGYPQAVDEADEPRIVEAAQLIAHRRAAARPDLARPERWRQKVARSLSHGADSEPLRTLAGQHPNWTAEQLADRLEPPEAPHPANRQRVDCDTCHGSGWLPDTDPAQRCDHGAANA